MAPLRVWEKENMQESIVSQSSCERTIDTLTVSTDMTSDMTTIRTNGQRNIGKLRSKEQTDRDKGKTDQGLI